MKQLSSETVIGSGFGVWGKSFTAVAWALGIAVESPERSEDLERIARAVRQRYVLASLVTGASRLVLRAWYFVAGIRWRECLCVNGNTSLV